MLLARDFFNLILVKSLVVFVGVFFFVTKSLSQIGSIDGEWRSYASDAGSTKFTNLSQIHGDNFGELEIAWTWASIDGELDLEGLLGSAAEDISFGRLQATPLMIEGVLYMLSLIHI